MEVDFSCAVFYFRDDSVVSSDRRKTVRVSIVLLAVVSCVWGLGCDNEVPTPVSATPLPITLERPDSVVFTEIIDLTVGAQTFRSVDVIGTILFEITPSADTVAAAKRTGPAAYDVFINTEMRFRRSQDYTMAQNWKAGGKSADRVMIETGSITTLRKSYQIWSIPNEAYINITYGITPTSVNLRILWVSYEPLLLD